MIKKSFGLVLALLLLSSMCAFAQKTVTIKGHVKFINDDFKVSVYQYYGTGKKVLAETMVDPTTQNYNLTVPVEVPGEAIVDCGEWQDVNIWLEDENLDIDFRGEDTAKIKVKNPPFVYIRGGKNNELMNLINFMAYRNYQAMIAYSQKTYAAKFADEENRKELTMSLYDFMGDDFRAYCRFFAESYADRNSVMAAISRLDYDENKKLIENTLTRLAAVSPVAKQLSDNYRKEIAEQKMRTERVKVGATAPEFEVKDIKNQTIKPANFKGKVLVIDFWASWCGPCRQEIPNLKKYYEEFKGKGVEFLSVSIDAKKEAWLKAMKEENMAWKQGWTTDAGKEVMDLYQFSGIPFILIIDKGGKIYRKNVRGEEIHQGIVDVLAGKPAQEEETTSISMGAMSM